MRSHEPSISICRAGSRLATGSAQAGCVSRGSGAISFMGRLRRERIQRTHFPRIRVSAGLRGAASGCDLCGFPSRRLCQSARIRRTPFPRNSREVQKRGCENCFVDGSGTDGKLKMPLLKAALRAKRNLRRGIGRLWTRARKRAAAKQFPAEDLDFLTTVAGELTGLEQTKFVLRSSLLSSKSRRFIRLHEVVPAAQPDCACPLVRIIEKRSAAPQEYEFYRLVAGQDRHNIPAPRLYAATDLGFKLRNRLRYVIYIEDVEQLPIADRAPQTACAIARGMTAVASMKLPASFPAKHAIRLSTDLLASFMIRAEAGGHTRDATTAKKLEQMAAGWPQILAVRQLNLPRVPAHNDLHEQNVRIRFDGHAQSQIVFIDWEAFAWNYLGADLHQSLRDAIRHPERRPFFELLRVRYVEQVSQIYAADVLHVDIAAHAYALTRSMSRVIRKAGKRELKLTFSLYDRLAELLATV